jgi:hypothetical protein
MSRAVSQVVIAMKPTDSLILFPVMSLNVNTPEQARRVAAMPEARNLADVQALAKRDLPSVTVRSRKPRDRTRSSRTTVSTSLARSVALKVVLAPRRSVRSTLSAAVSALESVSAIHSASLRRRWKSHLKNRTATVSARASRSPSLRLATCPQHPSWSAIRATGVAVMTRTKMSSRHARSIRVLRRLWMQLSLRDPRSAELCWRLRRSSFERFALHFLHHHCRLCR